MTIRHAAVAAVASALLAPAAVLAAAPQRTSPDAFRLGALAGIEHAEGVTGPSLRVDGIFGVKPISPTVGIALVVSAGYAYFHQEATVMYGRAESTSNVLKLVPAARLSFAASPTVRPYLDAGIGMYHWSQTVETTVSLPYYGVTSQSVSASDTGLMFRFAGGVQVVMANGVALGAEVGFNPYLGDVDDTTTSFLLAATFRL